MNRLNITIREATIDDAKLIASVVGNAIGEELVREFIGVNWLDVLTEVARLDTSQYSYRNALIAEVDGVAVGAVVGYDGALLNLLRAQTLGIIHRYNPAFVFSEDETEVGEYYLDSLYVKDQYRKIGIATCLITAFCDRAFSKGHTRVGLIVDFDNPTAERLYSSLGFERVKKRTFLGHQMWHLQKKIG